MGVNDNKVNDLVKYIPTTTPATTVAANDRIPAPTPVTNDATPASKPRKTKSRNNKMIDEVTSAMVNLGMAKRKAKQHVQQCYDDMNNTPTLTELLTHSIKSLST